MSRPVTLFTGQWADLPLATLAEKAKAWGYDGLELACWGDHFEVERAIADLDYCDRQRGVLQQKGLGVWAISNHLVGQATLDVIDARHKSILPKAICGDGNPAGVRERAVQHMKDAAVAAKRLGVKVVNGFTGSSIWHLLYSFPPVPPMMVGAGFDLLHEVWMPILDAFGDNDVRFALEVHPTEIAYDGPTSEWALDALDHHDAFGFNFDPSHLKWQGVDPVIFIRAFSDRIFHVHMKDVRVKPNGWTSVLDNHIRFGIPARPWNFASLGHGDVDFDGIIRALNDAGYTGPLSVEWEDSGMDREHGAKEACEFVRQVDFAPSGVAFDAAFDKAKQ
ncbi:MAG: sugar phosphate isomerase/epimerase [Candidatus Peribacteraceae bacterium]|nr:sugar phosphate isomerase/epimerase [Candidatus Peribacteraceae bacterium]MDD5742284.1 sugar phosphate isomerase/epimerase [Candidatus Peribacteraceae bacterium]